LWATQRKNERLLDEAFQTASAVLLVFSVNRSDAFQGYAQMKSPIGRPLRRGVDPFNGFGRLFDIEWLRLHDLPYQEVGSIRNPLNGDRPVQYSRDGQELSNSAGRRLCELIDKHVDNPESFAQSQATSSSSSPGASGAGSSKPSASPPGPYSLPVGPYLPPNTGSGRRLGSRSSSSSGSSGRHRKRRKRERKKKGPHPLESTFEEQIEFFLGLDYDEYVEWWKRFGSVSPGPTNPPGTPAPSPSAGQHRSQPQAAAHSSAAGPGPPPLSAHHAAPPPPADPHHQYLQYHHHYGAMPPHAAHHPCGAPPGWYGVPHHLAHYHHQHMAQAMHMAPRMY